MDNGSEVMLCHERLVRKLGLLGDKINYTLTGMTGSSEIEGQMVDITVKSIDEAFVVETFREVYGYRGGLYYYRLCRENTDGRIDTSGPTSVVLASPSCCTSK